MLLAGKLSEIKEDMFEKRKGERAKITLWKAHLNPNRFRWFKYSSSKLAVQKLRFLMLDIVVTTLYIK